MPKVEHRKARRDYESQGIKKGSMYFYVRLKTGPRSSRVLRSLVPFKPSQLTASSFRSGWYAAQEAWAAGQRTIDDATDLANTLRELSEEAGASFENMPEGLQQGDVGQMLEERRDEAEAAADAIDELRDELEIAIDEYNNAESESVDAENAMPDDPSEDDDHHLSELEQAAGDKEDEVESLKDQIGEAADNMP